MLFQEGRCIQKHLTVAPKIFADNQAAHTFNYLMLQRKVTATFVSSPMTQKVVSSRWMNLYPQDLDPRGQTNWY